MNSNDKSNPLRIVAWAHGASAPAASGRTGPSASGWTWHFEDQPAETGETVVKPSASSNRNPWPAGIMAIKGAVESAPLSAHVTLYVRDKVLILGLECGFIKTCGEKYANPELWEPLLLLIEEKGITINPILAAKADPVMRKLAVRVSRAAKAKLAAMGRVEAIKKSHGPRKQPKGTFPPLKASDEEGDS